MSTQLINVAVIINHSNEAQTVNIQGTDIICKPKLTVEVAVNWDIMDKNLDVLAADGTVFLEQNMYTQIFVNDPSPSNTTYMATFTIPLDTVPVPNPTDITANKGWLLGTKSGNALLVTGVGTVIGYSVKRFLQKPMIKKLEANRDMANLEAERLELERRAKVIASKRNGIEPKPEVKRKLFKDKEPEYKKRIKSKYELKFEQKTPQEIARKLAEEKRLIKVSKQDDLDYAKHLKDEKIHEIKQKQLNTDFEKARVAKVKQNIVDLKEAAKKQADADKKLQARITQANKDKIKYEEESKANIIKQVDGGIKNVSTSQKEAALARKKKYVKKGKELSKNTDDFINSKEGTFLEKQVLVKTKEGLNFYRREVTFKDFKGDIIKYRDVTADGKKLKLNIDGELTDSKGEYLTDLSKLESKGRTLISEENYDKLSNPGHYISNREIEIIKNSNVYESDLGIINKDGDYIDEAGRIIDIRGRILNEKYQMINKDGVVVNKDGLFINKSGVIENNGLPVTTNKFSDRTAFSKKHYEEDKWEEKEAKKAAEKMKAEFNKKHANENKYKINWKDVESSGSDIESRSSVIYNKAETEKNNAINKEIDEIDSNPELFYTPVGSDNEPDTKPSNEPAANSEPVIEGGNANGSSLGSKGTPADVNGNINHDNNTPPETQPKPDGEDLIKGEAEDLGKAIMEDGP